MNEKKEIMIAGFIGVILTMVFLSIFCYGFGWLNHEFHQSLIDEIPTIQKDMIAQDKQLRSEIMPACFKVAPTKIRVHKKRIKK